MLPYTPFQVPFVVVSVETNVADGPVTKLLLTVTVTGVEVLDWFRVSVAIAVIVWLALEDLVVSHATEYGPDPVTADPKFAPSNWN